MFSSRVGRVRTPVELPLLLSRALFVDSDLDMMVMTGDGSLFCAATIAFYIHSAVAPLSIYAMMMMMMMAEWCSVLVVSII